MLTNPYPPSVVSPSPMSLCLAPPSTQSRSRAHSTNLRPALTISTLGCRLSTSLDSAPQLPTLHTSDTITPVDISVSQALSSEPHPSPSMLAVIASRCFQLLHVSSKHSLQCSSPISSTDEYVLPISASSQQTTFGDVFGEKELSKAHASNAWWQGHPSVCHYRTWKRIIFTHPRHADSCPNIVCDITVTIVNGTCIILPVNVADIGVLATYPHRRGNPGKGASRILPKWSGPYGPCYRSSFDHRCVETRLVCTRKRYLGEHMHTQTH
jgi:hypothetical protein